MKKFSVSSYTVSRLMADCNSRTIYAAARFFGVLRFYFWGFWAWRTTIPVCETC